MTIFVNARFLTQSMTGVQRFAIEVCLQLKHHFGDNLVFVSPDNIVQAEYAKRLGVVTIGTHEGHLWEQWDLPRYLRKNGNPLLLCLCNTAPLFYENKVVTVHDVAFEAFPETFNKSFLYVYRFLIPRIIKASKHVVTVSEFSKQEIIKYYHTSAEKISVVNNAVSSSFSINIDVRFSAQKYFLAVSSLNFRKNFLTVLKAFDNFEKKNKDTLLYIIGDLSCDNFAGINISSYQSNPRIKFLGRVSDEALIGYYSNALAFVYPSLYEGFGIPPLEAQSCGCPVLCANIPPLREVLGDSALMCDPFDVQRFTDNMEQLASSPSLREDLISRGRENVKRFSWIESANKITHIISQINE